MACIAASPSAGSARTTVSRYRCASAWLVTTLKLPSRRASSTNSASSRGLRISSRVAASMSDESIPSLSSNGAISASQSSGRHCNSQSHSRAAMRRSYLRSKSRQAVTTVTLGISSSWSTCARKYVNTPCSRAIDKTSSESMTTTTCASSAKRAACSTHCSGRPCAWRSCAVARSANSRDWMKSGTRSVRVCVRCSSASCRLSITQVLPEPGSPVSKTARFLASMAARSLFTIGIEMRCPAMSRCHDLPMAEVLANDVRACAMDMTGTSIAPAWWKMSLRSSLVRRCWVEADRLPPPIRPPSLSRRIQRAS